MLSNVNTVPTVNKNALKPVFIIVVIHCSFSTELIKSNTVKDSDGVTNADAIALCSSCY